MTPDKLVEETARAICEADHHAWPGDDYSGREQRRFYIKQARAALAVALEACAKVADRFESDADPDAGAAMASAIRSLLPPRSE